MHYCYDTNASIYFCNENAITWYECSACDAFLEGSEYFVEIINTILVRRSASRQWSGAARPRLPVPHHPPFVIWCQDIIIVKWPHEAFPSLLRSDHYLCIVAYVSLLWLQVSCSTPTYVNHPTFYVHRAWRSLIHGLYTFRKIWTVVRMHCINWITF